MTAGHIRDSLFAELASTTPVDRTLKRLVERGYLSRLRRLIGGDHGGSGQFVYQLGRAGWKLLDKPGAYWAPRAVNLHTLAITDCYVTFKQAERDGVIEIIQFVTEPECHQAVGNVLLTPDAYMEIGNRVEQLKYSYWLEVDRGTEHLDKIQEKCDRYRRAHQLWRQEYFPRVLFVTSEVRRRASIRCAVGGSSDGCASLFQSLSITALRHLTGCGEDNDV
jgi:hypothetical protein